MDWFVIMQVYNSFWYKDWIKIAGTEVGISLYWLLPGWQKSIQTDPYLLHLAWFCQEWVDGISSDILRMLGVEIDHGWLLIDGTQCVVHINTYHFQFLLLYQLFNFLVPGRFECYTE